MAKYGADARNNARGPVLAGYILLLLLVLLLPACQRGNGEDPAATGTEEVDGFATMPSLPTPPSPVIDGGESDPGESEEGGVLVPVTPATGFEGRFSSLRFAASANGESQQSFPAGTEEIYAIWDYDGMSASDTIERIWYLNGQQLYERREIWNYPENGSVGAVRNVCIYDYIDGIDPGQWRLEVYLNGELRLEGEFTVGAEGSGTVSPLPSDQRNCINFY